MSYSIKQLNNSNLIFLRVNGLVMIAIKTLSFILKHSRSEIFQLYRYLKIQQTIFVDTKKYAAKKS